MNVRLALICGLVAVVLLARPIVALGQFGLSASPDLLPWLKSPPSSGIGFHNSQQGGGGISEPQQEEGPPMHTGWLAPLNGGHSGLTAAPEPRDAGREVGVVGRPDGRGMGVVPPETAPGHPLSSLSHQASPGCYRDLLEIPTSGTSVADCPGCFDSCGDPQSCWQWFIEPAGLIMGRNDPNRVWFTYQSNNNANELMHSQQARTSWQGGWELTIRRTFACDNWRLEGTYWGIAQMRGDASATHPEFVSSTLIFTDVVYADPTIPGMPEDLFFGTYEQKLWRTNEIHNVEVNLVRHRILWDIHRLGIDWLVGVRYFRFDERLTYGSRAHDGFWGEYPELEGYLSDRIENNLIGIQLGFDLQYPIGKSLQLACTPKIGLYNNHIHNRFDAYRGDGALFAPNPNPPVGDPVPGRYPVISSDDRFATLAQLDARVQWHVTPRWLMFIGYRLVSVSEIGLADAQFPCYVVDIVDAISHIDSNGDLLLHGAFAGMSIAF